MKHTYEALLARYLVALRGYLAREGPYASPAAKKLGRSVVLNGLATLDLARMHERAVVILILPKFSPATRRETIRRAGAFFTQALVPLELDRRQTRETNRLLRLSNLTLGRHTAALSRGTLRLKREVTRRRKGEEKLRQAKDSYRLLFLESQVMQGKLRQLNRLMISAQEEERKKISRELHDEVVQTLVGINVELTALSSQASLGMQTMKHKIAHTQRLVENSVSAVHRFARELRPAVLDDLGLIPALHAYSKSLAERKGIRIKMTAFGGVEALSNAKRTVLFRVAQEALNNVARHAEATEVRVNLTKVAGMIRMEVIDNGKSFQVRKILLARNNKRLGLVGMRERIEMIGGTLGILSAPKTGTTVRAEIPFKMEKAK